MNYLLGTDDTWTLTRVEREELFAAFDTLYDILVSQPSALQDYCTRAEYRAILKWRSLLAGAAPDDHEDMEEEEEDAWE